MTEAKLYEVTIRPQFAGYGDTGTTVEVYAKDKKGAVAEARKLNRRESFYDRFNGRVTFTAQEAGAP